MTPDEQQQVRMLNDKLENEISIRLIGNAHEASNAMAAFCEELATLASGIRLIREKDDERQAPVIEVTESIAYSGVPTGTELAPFMELLSTVGRTDTAGLSAITAPAILTLYVSSMCPHCPAMVRQVYPLCLKNRNLKLSIIDGPAFPELAEADNIKSLPTLILDNNFRWTALVDVDELVQIIGSRNPAVLGVASLKGMIQDGNAYDLSEMMVSEKKIFPAFVELLVHPEFSVRLGAMAAIEDVAERAGSLAGQVVVPLMDLFDQLDDQIKGDILYVIGVCGDKGAVSFLGSVATATQNEELWEAAEDALEAITTR
jgi:hypothetical protein